jgi:hypothetical protein
MVLSGRLVQAAQASRAWGLLGLRLVEVGVPVQEQQAVAGAAPQRQGDAEQDGAVAAEHDRDCLGVDGGAEGVGQRDGVVAQPVRVEQTRGRVDLGVEGRGGQPRPGPGAQPLGQAGGEQGLGEPLDPRGAQAEVGGRLDDGVGGHGTPGARGWSGGLSCPGPPDAPGRAGRGTVAARPYGGPG